MKTLEKIWDRLSNFLLPESNDTIKVVVLCLFTATTFWFFNALNDNYSTRITYPIKFTYPDSSLVVVKDLPKRVRINVSGGGWNLLRKTFWFTITPVEVPLEDPANTNYIMGNSLYTLIADQMTEIQLNYIENDTLRIEIDSIRSTQAKLYVDSSAIKLAKDYRLISPIKISHDSATFTGPERFIKKIPQKISIDLEEENISSDFEQDIYLSTFGSSLVNRDPVEVTISFQVAKYIQQELMLPYEKINAPEDSSSYIFEDSLARISFKVQEAKAGNYDLDSIMLVMDYQELNYTDSTVRPKIISLPQQLQQKDIMIDSLSFQYLSEE